MEVVQDSKKEEKGNVVMSEKDRILAEKQAHQYRDALSSRIKTINLENTLLQCLIDNYKLNKEYMSVSKVPDAVTQEGDDSNTTDI
jgi:hypothetical protein